MHPTEMENSALAAAVKAEQGGFVETARAFRLLAEVCAGDARKLGVEFVRVRPTAVQRTPSGRVVPSLVSH
jgi:hypothetical protein